MRFGWEGWGGVGIGVAVESGGPASTGGEGVEGFECLCIAEERDFILGGERWGRAIAFGREAFAEEWFGGVGVESPEAEVEVDDGEAAIRE